MTHLHRQNKQKRAEGKSTLSLRIALSMRHNKLSGFYQLDAQGEPTFFLGVSPPLSILGRVGVNRKKFLQALSENQ